MKTQNQYSCGCLFNFHFGPTKKYFHSDSLLLLDRWADPIKSHWLVKVSELEKFAKVLSFNTWRVMLCKLEPRVAGSSEYIKSFWATWQAWHSPVASQPMPAAPVVQTPSGVQCWLTSDFNWDRGIQRGENNIINYLAIFAKVHIGFLLESWFQIKHDVACKNFNRIRNTALALDIYHTLTFPVLLSVNISEAVGSVT